ncbi:MAG TPA: glycosyltransferase family 2 protein [Kiritimatiellia bacterium]|nr:glycosyltransferase family 2 protein [Kiritimatiellia bacterium]HQQ03691.1 glycosyltransferase family 2 protein [Kiritimatiellia bacterium]
MSAKSDHPLLSIITVCRNEAGRIRRTIDSVVQQSDLDFEWIVVDGASSDGTVDILRHSGAPIDRLISEPDTGIYDAMNKGVLAARGEYTLFLNAGDRLENRDVVHVFRERNFKADLVVGDIRVILKNGRELLRKCTDRPLDRDFLYWRSFPHPGTFIRRSLFERHGLYDISFKIAADREFFNRVVSHGASVEPFSHCISVFTNDGVSYNFENRKRLYGERRRIRRIYYPASYRWRRAFNETFGHCVHQILTKTGVRKS